MAEPSTHDLRPADAPRLTPTQRIRQLEADVHRLKMALGSLILWTAQAANSPIRADEATQLFNILNGRETT